MIGEKNICERCGYHLDAQVGACFRCEELSGEELTIAKCIAKLGATWDSDGTITTDPHTLHRMVSKVLKGEM